jgi:hypothetical protein
MKKPKRPNRASVGDDLPTLMRAQAPRARSRRKIVQEVDQELWDVAVENVTKQQEEAFEGLFDEAVDAHLANDECEHCDDGISDNCEEQIKTRIEEWQKNQFDDQVEAEYDRLEEQQEEQEED